MKKFNIPSIEKPIFSTILQVRVYDLNYGNHLGHDSLLSLAHESRVRFFKLLGFTELDIDGLSILITNLIINYKGEAFYDDEITINIGIDEIYKTGLDLIYELKIKNSNKQIANILTTINFFDYKNSRISKIPEIFLKKTNEVANL